MTTTLGKSLRKARTMLANNPSISTAEIMAKLQLAGLNIDGRTIAGLRRQHVYRIGAASATILAGAFGDDVAFDVDWSRYGFSGVTRTYDGFWDAANEMADSRIYGGIHFRFDSVAGQQIGADVGNHIMDNLLQPRGTTAPLPAGSGNAARGSTQMQIAVEEAGLFSGALIGGLLQQAGLVGDPGSI